LDTEVWDEEYCFSWVHQGLFHANFLHWALTKWWYSSVVFNMMICFGTSDFSACQKVHTTLPARFTYMKKLGSIWNYMSLQWGDDELSVVQVISNSQAMAVLDDLGSILNDLPACGSFVKSCWSHIHQIVSLQVYLHETKPEKRNGSSWRSLWRRKLSYWIQLKSGLMWQSWKTVADVWGWMNTGMPLVGMEMRTSGTVPGKRVATWYDNHVLRLFLYCTPNWELTAGILPKKCHLAEYRQGNTNTHIHTIHIQMQWWTAHNGHLQLLSRCKSSKEFKQLESVGS
jgi:hypothetical protein